MTIRTILGFALVCLSLPHLALAAEVGDTAATLAPASGCEPFQLAGTLGEPLFATTFTSLAYCRAECEDGTYRSCSGDSCSAQDQNCSLGIQGHATCDDTPYECPACPVCDDGQTRQVRDGCCQGSGYDKQRWRFDECFDGQWVAVSSSCSGECLLAP